MCLCIHLFTALLLPEQNNVLHEIMCFWGDLLWKLLEACLGHCQFHVAKLADSIIIYSSDQHSQLINSDNSSTLSHQLLFP